MSPNIIAKILLYYYFHSCSSAQYANVLYIYRIHRCALCTGYCIPHHTQLDSLVPVWWMIIWSDFFLHKLLFPRWQLLITHWFEFNWNVIMRQFTVAYCLKCILLHNVLHAATVGSMILLHSYDICLLCLPLAWTNRHQNSHQLLSQKLTCQTDLNISKCLKNITAFTLFISQPANGLHTVFSARTQESVKQITHFTFKQHDAD